MNRATQFYENYAD